MSPLNVAICTTYLERQKCYGPDKKILFKKQLFDLEVKGQGPTKVIMVCDTPHYGHAPTYQIKLTYLERQKFWSGQASLRSRRKNQTKTMSPFVRRGDIITLHTVVGHFQLWNFFVYLDMLNIFAV